MEDQKMKRVSYIDVMKGIGIFLVVFQHILNAGILPKWIMTYHMPLFFFVAGMTYHPKSNRLYCKNKFNATLIPYYFWGIITAAYGLLFEHQFRSLDYNIWDCVLGILTGEYQYLKFNVVLWFLPAYFLTMTLFNFATNIKDVKLSYGISFAFFCVAAFIKLPGLFFGFNRTCMYMIFVASGHYFVKSGMLKKLLENTTLLKNILFMIAALVLSIGAAWVVFHFKLFHAPWPLALPGIMLVFFAALILQNSKILQYIGKNTMLIFAVHGPLYRALLGALSLVSGQSPDFFRKNIVLSLIVSLITVGFCLLLNMFVSRYLPWSVGKRENKKDKI